MNYFELYKLEFCREEQDLISSRVSVHQLSDMLIFSSVSQSVFNLSSAELEVYLDLESHIKMKRATLSFFHWQKVIKSRRGEHLEKKKGVFDFRKHRI